MLVLGAAEQRLMPWKNGGGFTTEIAVSPPGASMLDFDWRVSMARIEADGAFSLFPGVDRCLMVLAGDGVTLAGTGVDEVHLTTASAPCWFAADVPVSARLHGGGVSDLNVMTRRGVCHARITRLDLSAPLRLTRRAAMSLLWSYEDALRVADGAKTWAVAARDCAMFGQAGASLIIQAEAGARVVLIEIDPI